VAFINRAILFGIKCYVGLEAGHPLIYIALNLEKLKEIN
jgi:hypothetical protein